MTPEKFDELKKHNYSHIPLVKEVLADLDTPLSAYLKLANAPYTYLFESVHGGEKWGRYSIIGLPCAKRIKIFGQKIVIENGYENTETLEVEDPLAWVEAYQKQFNVAEIEGLPKFTGGLVGYFGYETIRYIEPKLAGVQKPDDIETPDILLMLSEEVVVFDNLSGKLYFIILLDPAQDEAYQKGQARLQQLQRQLHQSVPGYKPAVKSVRVKEEDFVSGFTEQGYKDAVAKARQYIIDGDVMQVVLSQRMTIPFNAAPLDLYRSLRSLNPSPYMYYLNLDDHHVVGSSPEILVRLEDGKVTVRPIAGTRPRGQNETEDVALEKELLTDPKELAEHLMLIDLGRNDAGRVSKTGSVELTEKMRVERYSHVMHIVSNVTGELNDNMSVRWVICRGMVIWIPPLRFARR